MLKNYIIVALRNIFRNRIFSLIKMTSLAIGMFCFALISLFVYHELSFDRFHENPEQVYRVVKDFVNEDGSTIPDATTPPAMGPAIAKDLPEVAYTTRLFPSWGRKYLLQYEDVSLYEEALMRIDSSFFDVFSFLFLKGDPKTSLALPNYILMTESAAARYFGKEDPIGKAVKIDIGQTDPNFFVTGILKDIPENSHFTFDFLISIRTFQYNELDTDWGWYNFYTYTRLKPGTDPALFIEKLQPVFQKHNPESKTRYYAQNITDIHLKSNLKWELGSNGDESYIRILAGIALIVVVLAGINYINLVTAQSVRRAKEVGVRKVSGAGHGSLVRQFLLESAILAVAASIISLAVAEAVLPFFSNLFDSPLSFFSPENRNLIWMVLGVGLLTGALAGIYPAFLLSAFKPVNVLKGSPTSLSGGTLLRKGLVTFQFVISTVLIMGALVISNQIEFIRNKKIGFDKENILMIKNANGLQNRAAIQEELKKIDGVVNVGGADGILGGQNWTNDIQTKEGENSLLLNFLCTDYGFLDAMNVQFIEGRNFSPEHGTDSTAIILNETAARQLGIKEPRVGTQVITGEDGKGNPTYSTVIGVMEDFHFTSFHEPIKPFGFFLYQPRVNTIFVKLNSENISETIEKIGSTWSTLVPQRPFESTFQDEQVAKLYNNDQKFQKLFTYFTGVAIAIACLGLLGLSAYTAQARTKEIGIRKVLGASVLGITQLLSRDFLKLVVVAILLSAPLAWFIMERWLENFAYHVKMNVWTFALSGLGALLIALMTVSFQSIKAATANPVESLRNE